MLGSQPLPQLPAALRLQSAEHGDDVRHQADSTAGEGAAQMLSGAQAATLGQGPEALYVPKAAVRRGSDEAAHVQEAVGSVGTKAAQVLQAAMPTGSDGHGLQEGPVPDAAMPAGSAHDGSGPAPLPEAEMPSGRAHDGSGPASVPEAATRSGNQDTDNPTTRQQPHKPHDQHSPPSILQDLRNAAAAAQDTVRQPQDPASPTAGLTSQQTPLEATQVPQQALLQLQSRQGVTSMQEESRLTTAPQFASLAFAPVPKDAAPALPQAEPPCSPCQTPPALPPLAQTSDAMPEDQGITAGSNPDRQVAGANQALMNERTAVAEHSDSLSTALLPEAEVPAVTAVQEKQPVVRSQRLFEKKAAAAAAQAAADAVVKTAALQDQVMLGGVSIKQAGLVLAPTTVEAVSSTVPLVLAECLASNRSKRVPGGDPLEVSSPLPRTPPLLPSVEGVHSGPGSHGPAATRLCSQLTQYRSHMLTRFSHLRTQIWPKTTLAHFGCQGPSCTISCRRSPLGALWTWCAATATSLRRRGACCA